MLIWLLVFALSAFLAAQSHSVETSTENFFPRDQAILSNPTVNQLHELSEKEIPFELRPAAAGSAEVWLSEEEYERYQAEGWEVEWTPPEELSFWEAPLPKGATFEFPLERYPTHDEITAYLMQVTADNPNLCRLENAGDSVMGRELWFLKITDNPDIEEDEPEFKYISSMHGDEPVGMVMLLNLIDLILDRYETDLRFKTLVDETEIWIMPLMNPDGYMRNPRARTNARGIDLNRNFPDRVDDPINSPEGREVETQAIMNFGFAHSSVLSANFHTGELLVNYPYDSAPSVPDGLPPTIPPQPDWFSPDDDLFQAISLVYSSNNPPMFNHPRFNQGITNGISWFSVRGGMQDWNYEWLGCNEVTLEISNVFVPSATLLPSFWGNNRESMLSYMEQVHIGVRGIVADARTGDPLPATVRVVGRDHDVFADPDVGDYHRMLLPGTYDLVFSAAGYRSLTVEDVVVNEGAATRLDVELEPARTMLLAR